tara:strand:+ start:2023 stop:2247 length:225 start_codon:yes stop_codon:yes gene_type:complete
MIDENEIPLHYYRIEYQTNTTIGTDEWECGDAYETNDAAQQAMIGHINGHPYLPVRINRIQLLPIDEILGRYAP